MMTLVYAFGAGILAAAVMCWPWLRRSMPRIGATRCASSDTRSISLRRLAHAMHLGIEWSIRVGFFSLTILTLYLAFLDPAWCSAQLRRLQRRLVRGGATRPTGLAARAQP